MLLTLSATAIQILLSELHAKIDHPIICFTEPLLVRPGASRMAG